MFLGAWREHHQFLDSDGEVELEAEELRAIPVAGVAEHGPDTLEAGALLAFIVGELDGNGCDVVVGHLGLSFLRWGSPSTGAEGRSQVQMRRVRASGVEAVFVLAGASAQGTIGPTPCDPHQ